MDIDQEKIITSQVSRDILSTSKTQDEVMVKCANWLANDAMLKDFQRIRLREAGDMPEEIKSYITEKEGNKKTNLSRYVKDYPVEGEKVKNWYYARIDDLYSNLSGIHILAEYMGVEGLTQEVKDKFAFVIRRFKGANAKIISQISQINPVWVLFLGKDKGLANKIAAEFGGEVV